MHSSGVLERSRQMPKRLVTSVASFAPFSVDGLRNSPYQSKRLSPLAAAAAKKQIPRSPLWTGIVTGTLIRPSRCSARQSLSILMVTSALFIELLTVPRATWHKKIMFQKVSMKTKGIPLEDVCHSRYDLPRQLRSPTVERCCLPAI